MTNELLKNAKPILFNTEMVNAIQDGRKVQARRVYLNNDAGFNLKKVFSVHNYIGYYDIDCNSRTISIDDFIDMFSKYKKGDILWVREPVGTRRFSPYTHIHFWYKADGRDCGVNNHTIQIPTRISSNITPKWILNEHGVPNGCIKEMARIFLKVINIRVERLQDITHKDIFREGFSVDIADYFITDKYHKKANYKCFTDNEQDVLSWWFNLWNSTSRDGYKWEYNPLVFVYEFEVL